MKRFLISILAALLLCAPAFGMEDPYHSGKSLSNSSVTPAGGTQGTLANALKVDGTTIVRGVNGMTAVGASASFPSGTAGQLLGYESTGVVAVPFTLGTNLTLAGTTLNASYDSTSSLQSGGIQKSRGSATYVQNSAVLSLFDGGAGTEWVSTLGPAPANDTVNVLNNIQSIALTATSGGTKIDKTGAVDLSDYDQMRIKFFVDDATKLHDVTVIASNNNYATAFSSAIPGAITSHRPCVQDLGASPTYGTCADYTTKLTSFTASGSPSWASIDKLRLSVTATGANTVHVAIAELSAIKNKNAKAKILLTFDDGMASLINPVAGILSARGLVANAAIVPVSLDTSTYLTTGQVKALQNNFGWDIISHGYTHTDLTTLSSAAVETEIKNWLSWASANGIKRSNTIAYPFDKYNDTVISQAKKYFVFGRSTDGQDWSQSDPYQYQYNLKTQNIVGPSSQTTLATAEGWVDTAVTDKAVLILAMHNIKTTPSADTDWDTADFTSLAAYLKTKVDAGEAEVITFSQLEDQFEREQQNMSVAGTSSASSFDATDGYLIGGVNAISYPGNSDNIAIGEGTLAGVTATNLRLTMAGKDAGNAVTSGADNTGFGYNALNKVTSNASNTAIGSWSQRKTTGYSNTSVGSFSMYNAVGAYANTGLGTNSLYSLTSAYHNAFVGYWSGYSITTGIGNSGLGHQPLYNTSTGNYNTAVGWNSCYSNTTGSNNVCLGGAVGYVGMDSGSGNILIGTSSAVTLPTSSTNNYLNIGNFIKGTMGVWTLTLPADAGTSGYVLSTDGAGTTSWIVQASGTGGGMVYPAAGLALSTGTGWSSSVTNNSANWNTAYGWGNHASAGYLTTATLPVATATTIGAVSVGAGLSITASGVLSATGTGGGSVSITAASANVVVSPSPITGTGTVDLGAAVSVATSLTAPLVNATTLTSGYQINGLNAISKPMSDLTSMAIGTSALASQTTTGQNNLAAGYLAGQYISSGTTNTAFGSRALLGNTATKITGADNTAVGYNAGAGSIGTAAGNTFIGSGAGVNNTLGTNNEAIGYGAGGSITIGVYNTAVGNYAGYSINGFSQGYNVSIGANANYSTAGSHNTAVGYNAISGGTGGASGYNSCLGEGCLALLTGGANPSNNSALGYYAGRKLTTGASNLFLGFKVGSTTLTTGSNNILIGTSTLVDTTASGTSNSLNIGNLLLGVVGNALGSNRLLVNTATDDGASALQVNGAASFNGALTWTGTGAVALASNMNITATGTGGDTMLLGTVVSSTSLGKSSLAAANKEGDNTAVGNQAMRLFGGIQGYYQTGGYAALGNGEHNVAIGSQAMGVATATGCTADTGAGSFNVAVGYGALYNQTCGMRNVAIGDHTLGSITTGSKNVGNGRNALSSVTTGTDNVALGDLAGNALTTGTFNFALGSGALYTDTTGNESIAIGASALHLQNFTGNDWVENLAIGNNAGAAITSGNHNTIIGQQTGSHITTGTYNVILGYSNATATLTTGSNNILIGNSLDTTASGTSGMLKIGAFITATSTTTVAIPGVTTGTNADFACFASGGVFTLQSSACTISQRKLKENFVGVDGAIALYEIMKLKPTQFNFKATKPANPDPNATKTQFGFVAEEVADIDSRLAVYENDMKTPKSYRQEALIALLVAAVQAQQHEIESLRIHSGDAVHKCFFGLLICPNNNGE